MEKRKNQKILMWKNQQGNVNFARRYLKSLQFLIIYPILKSVSCFTVQDWRISGGNTEDKERKFTEKKKALKENWNKKKKKYDSNPEVRQKKKEYYELKKELKKRKKQENISTAIKGLKINSFEDLRRKHRRQRKLEQKRKKYNSNPETRQKKKEHHQLKRELNKKKKQENIALAIKGLNINSKSEEPEDPEVKELDMHQCEFCRKKYEVFSILSHISNSEECKLFYGPRLVDLRREHRRMRKRGYRTKNGTEKELKQQRNRYN